jgi:hypothetical protein
MPGATISTAHDPAAAGGSAAPAYAWAGSWAAILLLVGAVTALRIVYILWLCPYDLIEDEAHYWEWGRRLDWSYYSKGPGVALLIAAATDLLGTTAGTVRLPAALCGGIATLAVAGLAADATGDRRIGFLAAAATLLTPIFQLQALLMTIDGPYVACWAVGSWAAWRALQRSSRSAWLVLGIAIGAGFLFKYTILLLPPSILAYAILRRKKLNCARGALRWAMFSAAFAMLGALPVVIWNAQNDWPTIHHLLGHLGMPGGDVPAGRHVRGWNYQWRWTLSFLGGQLALVGAPLVLGVYSAVVAIRRRKGEPEAWGGRLFLLCLWAPMMLFYLAVSLFTEVEGNWPVAGYVGMLALCGWGALDAAQERRARTVAWRALPRPRPWRGIFRRRPQLHRHVAWQIAVIGGLVVGIGSLRLDLLTALPVTGHNWTWRGQERRPLIPIGRLMGASQMGAHVALLADDLRRAGGGEPMIIAQHYGRASQLAFYGAPTGDSDPDALRPIVYSSSSFMAGRQTQYDYWEDTDLTDPALRGRNGVLVGATRQQWEHLFDRVEPIGPLAGETKPNREAFLGYGFRPPRRNAAPAPRRTSERTEPVK